MKQENNSFLKIFQKGGAFAILGVIILGCYTYLPPLFSGAAFIVGVSKKFSDAEARIQTNSERLVEHDQQIAQSLRNIREFRSVWCLDRLSGRVVQSAVRETCTKWIKEP